jgi:hypothetical protein
LEPVRHRDNPVDRADGRQGFSPWRAASNSFHGEASAHLRNYE